MIERDDVRAERDGCANSCERVARAGRTSDWRDAALACADEIRGRHTIGTLSEVQRLRALVDDVERFLLELVREGDAGVLFLEEVSRLCARIEEDRRPA